MMTDDLARYDDFWAAFFGVEAAQLRCAGVKVVRHARLGNYRGLWFFVRESSVVVSTPEAWFARVTAQVDRIAAEPIPGAALLRDLLGAEPARVIGPAYQGYLTREAFAPVRDPNVRELTTSDEAALLELRSACSPQEWDHSALASATDPRFGYFLEGRLRAAAGTGPWSGGAVSPGVLSHPESRRRGYGTAVVSAVVEHALARGRLPLFQTMMENIGSLSIAAQLGFRQYATHMAVRCAAPA